MLHSDDLIRLLLMLSGDVEENPGPPPQQHHRAEDWLGVSDAAATDILGRIRYAAEILERMPCDPQLPLERPAHQWNHLAMKILASSIERLLPRVRGAQGLLAGDVAHLPASVWYGTHGGTYLSQVDPIPSLEMKHTEGDGNCHQRSLLVSVFGSEMCGWVALRLRCLLHFLVNSARYYRAEKGPGAENTDYGASAFPNLATPASYLCGRASAIAASVLQCPILLYNPGHKLIPHRELESSYIPPLFVQEEGYTSRVPIIQMWSYYGSGVPVETTPWLPNHFEAGFLPTAAHYNVLLSADADHDLYLQGYYEHGAGRDPRWAWDTQDSFELHQLPPDSDERRLVDTVLASVRQILRPASVAMAMRCRQRASNGTRRNTRKRSATPGAARPRQSPAPAQHVEATQAADSVNNPSRPPRRKPRWRLPNHATAQAALRREPSSTYSGHKRKRDSPGAEGRSKIARKANVMDTARRRKHNLQAIPDATTVGGRKRGGAYTTRLAHCKKETGREHAHQTPNEHTRGTRGPSGPRSATDGQSASTASSGWPAASRAATTGCEADEGQCQARCGSCTKPQKETGWLPRGGCPRAGHPASSGNRSCTTAVAAASRCPTAIQRRRSGEE